MNVARLQEFVIKYNTEFVSPICNLFTVFIIALLTLTLCILKHCIPQGLTHRLAIPRDRSWLYKQQGKLKYHGKT